MGEPGLTNPSPLTDCSLINLVNILVIPSFAQISMPRIWGH